MAADPELDDLRASVRQFLANRNSEDTVRALMTTHAGYDEGVWKQMAQQLGLQGVHIPEEYGGAGFGHVELGIVLEEMGRSLLGGPFFPTVVLAANALLLSGDEQAKRRWLPPIAEGNLLATVAFTEDAGSWDPAVVATTAVPAAGGHELTGTKSFVLDGHTAGLLLVTARTDAGVGVFAVDADARGLTRTPLNTLDQTRRQATVRLDRTPAVLVGADGGGTEVLTAVLDLAAVGLAAEQVGGAQRVLDMAVEYAKVRVQFGRPIGSFQAIKHKCAEVLVEVESARAAMQYALWCADEHNGELPVVACLAKAYCSETYFRATAENIQVHGGIGFTWEHPAHLYFKRAKSSELLFGDAAYHRELLVHRIGI
ncbi:acyl-CoA dehydrogenase family protein [Pseudonocardia sulfidoxydans]|nr:acyl-CoA dehydrogenase family protein [Pseudonocardia sulfidoxydans]